MRLRLSFLFVAVLALSGCGAWPPSLQLLGEGVTVCADSAMYSDVLYGLPAENTGSQPLAILSVAADETTNIAVEEWWVVDAGSDGLVGLSAFPPTDVENWDTRHDVAGATLAAGAITNLAVHLRLEPGETEGGVRGVTVTYVDAVGRSGSVHSDVAMGLAPAIDCTGD